MALEYAWEYVYSALVELYSEYGNLCVHSVIEFDFSLRNSMI